MLLEGERERALLHSNRGLSAKREEAGKNLGDGLHMGFQGPAFDLHLDNCAPQVAQPWGELRSWGWLALVFQASPSLLELKRSVFTSFGVGMGGCDFSLN